MALETGAFGQSRRLGRFSVWTTPPSNSVFLGIVAEGTVGHFQEVGGLTAHSPSGLQGGLQIFFFQLRNLGLKIHTFGGNPHTLGNRRGDARDRSGEVGKLDDAVSPIA